MSRSGSTLWTVLFAALGVTVVGLCGLALVAVTPGAVTMEPPLRLALGEGRRADAALTATPVDLAKGGPAAQRASAMTPYDSSARLRLAYIDALDGDLSPEGVRALELSYELLPFDHYVAAWRVRFALDHWDRLSPAVRSRVESEAFAFARTTRRAEMVTALSEVRSPVGVVPATFWRIRIQREHREKVAERRAAASSR